ncbi:MAG: hypothetical protein J5760_02305 [Clostridia bacterium]|nr:hypothetical protein [Clostridia bacterium]
MKYFFGMDTTEDKNNEIYDGERFVSASISEELNAKTERAAGLAEKADKLCAVSPAPRKMAQAFATFAVIWSILLIISLVRGDADFSSWPMIITVAMVALSAVASFFLFRRAARQLKQTPEQAAAIKEANEAFAQVTAGSARELGVPEDCATVDVLCFVYTVKDGVPEPYSMFRMALFMNYPRKMFLKDGYLCISDIRKLYKIPADSLGAFETVAAKTGLTFWNKDVSYRSAEYAPYGIRRGGNGIFTMDSYVQIKATVENEEYALLFPSYEKEAVERILGR